MHEPLIVLIVLPLAHVSNYICTWVLLGSSPSLEVQDHLEAIFKNPELHGSGKFHYLEGYVYGVKCPKEEWSRALLFKFIESQNPSPRVIRFVAENFTALTRRIPFDYRQVLPTETTKVKTWKRRDASTRDSG